MNDLNHSAAVAIDIQRDAVLRRLEEAESRKATLLKELTALRSTLTELHNTRKELDLALSRSPMCLEHTSTHPLDGSPAIIYHCMRAIGHPNHHATFTNDGTLTYAWDAA